MTQISCKRCGEASNDAAEEGLCRNCLTRAGQLSLMGPATPCPHDDRTLLANGKPAPENPDHTNEWVNDGSRKIEEAKDRWEIGGLLTPPEAPGELGRLGGYRILDILGGGGMGVVFLALDPILDRQLAIKAMRPSVASNPANRQRFQKEIRGAAAQKSEHIITIHHAGEERGIPYLVMELLEGESLDLRLQRVGRLQVEEIIRISMEIAEGLSATHDKNLIHRDIKPANIWLEGERGHVKIFDFGLARSIADDVQITQPGTILGTPAYMSPEQARGDAIDHRSDLFSLGAILYRLCTGKPPFSGENSYAVLTSLAMDTPRSIYEENADAPPALVNLVTSLLAKDPDDRPTSARAVVEALENIRLDLIRGDILGLDKESPGLVGDVPLAEPADSDYDLVTDLDPVDEEAELPALPDNVEELVGCTLKHYAIRSLLARARHGLVFRARDLDHGQVVALKVLSPEFPGNDREIQQFSKAMSQMLPVRHPNIVSVSAAGKTGDFCWIAMDFVEGESLEDAFKRWSDAGHVSWRRAFRIAVDIGQALLATRQRRLIHSNLTMRNILIRRADQTAMLNDLVFLKAVKNSGLYNQVFEEKFAAEVYFTAPEQLDTEKSFIDHLCDLYGLGVIVYYVLTGRPPFWGATVDETLQMIRHDEPVPPRKFNKKIPHDFENMVLRLMAKNQEDRYQSPDELLADLRIIARQHDIP